ncbi:MSHA biogenesis protein MshP [Enterovibrio sp. ZSDZ35]|uniref:MSHA biogenesis protein MshP n=1 Tax=Enterovibrio qingdaonensis TaxID=2899818 RepID=A0ABT5QMI7_9GAMM|nr:MSHA biogenesis protein MshP [Enterovibrio sp. ZSDZ35]MDD1782207.1 MSHA biogenesis protein MshP [Enterovibrio sp. ZSDZ35]
MRHNHHPSFHAQRGSMLVIAVFAMTAMAALGAALMQINWSQKDTTTREVLGTRAWFAANSGTEYAMVRLFPLEKNPNLPSAGACETANAVIPFTSKGLLGCSAKVTCETLGTAPSVQYRIESRGECGSGSHKVVRVQESWARGIAP